jgi:hypothetical protein
MELEGRNTMSKMRLNPIFESVRGKFGDLVFRRSHGKQTITRLPDMTNVVWSEAQINHRRRIGEASLRANAAMKNPEIYSYFEQLAKKKKRKKRPIDLAVSHYYHNDGDPMIES